MTSTSYGVSGFSGCRFLFPPALICGLSAEIDSAEATGSSLKPMAAADAADDVDDEPATLWASLVRNAAAELELLSPSVAADVPTVLCPSKLNVV